MLHARIVTGGVITSAGVMLAAMFASLSVLPLIWGLQLGLLVALRVLLDTLVVRTLLLPALALDTRPRGVVAQHARATQASGPEPTTTAPVNVG